MRSKPTCIVKRPGQQQASTSIRFPIDPEHEQLSGSVSQTDDASNTRVNGQYGSSGA
jgi:hypothetical protein